MAVTAQGKDSRERQPSVRRPEAHNPGETRGVENVVAQRMARLEPRLSTLLSEEARQFLKEQPSRVAEFGFQRDSPIINILRYAGNYWSCAVIFVLRLGPFRPSMLRAVINASLPVRPISQRMLTLNLRNLERDGVVERKIHQATTRRIEYDLTDFGKELSRIMLMLVDWAAKNAQLVTDARARFDEKYDCS